MRRERALTRRDSIALVISIMLLIMGLDALIRNGEREGVFFVAIVIVYWGVRYIRKDIKFIKPKPKEK